MFKPVSITALSMASPIDRPLKAHLFEVDRALLSQLDLRLRGSILRRNALNIPSVGISQRDRPQ